MMPSEPFVGQLMLVPFSFAPPGWAFCNGQLFQIEQYPLLFSILGTMYGGDGKKTFALPNLQGRAAIHAGQGEGLSSYSVGQKSGEEFHTLAQNEMPIHTHAVGAYSSGGGKPSPQDNVWAALARGRPPAYSNDTSEANLVAMSAQALAPSGENQPHNNMSPYLSLSFIIALQGKSPY